MGDGVLHEDCVVERDKEQIKEAIKKVLADYDYYSEWYLKNSKKYHWDKVCRRLNRIYETTLGDDFMLENMSRLYDNVKKRKDSGYRKPTYKVDVSFIEGCPKVFITGECDEKLVSFIDNKTNEVVHEATIDGDMWSMCTRRWYTDWRVEVDDVVEHLDLKNKNVLIDFNSSSLGDNIAWIPFVEEFRQKHNCNVYCATWFNSMFEKEYPEINFINQGGNVNNLYTRYNFGWWFGNMDYNPRDCREIPLQQTATDILGLDYKEIKTKITIPDKPRTIDEPYVCIGIHGTAQCKYWNHKDGWQKVVDYLNKQGYKVVLISKENSFGVEPFMNYPPENIIDKTGDYSLEDRMVDLNHAEYYIGIGSGLSWLAWAVGTPTILISSMSKPWHEFTTNSIRVYKESKNSGFWNNSKYRFDRGVWNWNPIKKMKSLDDWNEFEPIQYDDVKLVIDKTNRELSGKSLLSKTRPHTKYKVKLVHLLTRPEDKREQESIKSLEVLKDYGIDYVQHINEPYTDDPPLHTAFPDPPSPLSSGHYGAWESFRKGVIDGFKDDHDFLILCECDCVLTVEPEKFIEVLNEVCEGVNEKDISYFSFGDRMIDGELNSPIHKEYDDSDLFYQTYKIVLAHCTLIPKKVFPYLLDCYDKIGWDSPDTWFNHVFQTHPLVGEMFNLQQGLKMGILYDEVAKQHEGESLIDNTFKKEDRIQMKSKAFIVMGSNALGDTIAWAPYCVEYKKQFGFDEVVVCTDWNNILEPVYPELTFVKRGEMVYDITKRHTIDFAGLTLKEEEMYDNPNTLKDYKECSVQEQASNCLGLEHKEIKPRIYIPDKSKKFPKKYVCLAIQSTTQAKYWNLDKGWERIIKYIEKLGYQVICIDRYASFGSKGNFNLTPKSAFNLTGDFPIEDRIVDINHAEFFIGTSSGLAWVAHAVGTPVVMVSGFTKPWNEFTTNIERVHNDNVCNGCWNRCQFDASNWDWCPEDKDYECTTEISFEMVKDAVNKVHGSL
jgi:autotransporter strand-loop-strand O-heptosyltransferase